ncbi:hypothetical protein CP533_1064 [Ophiocordyceps camponoti-saundersi (nom. inval.)]|nr:hypothetical protein CP533_1064 [Ophiocordyceps camponoti-saundersi (nom. inval.)]
MESPDGSSQTRPFQPVVVGPCHAQTASDRVKSLMSMDGQFGNGVGEVISDREQSFVIDGSVNGDASSDWFQSSSDTDEDEDDDPESSIHQIVPTMQRFRNNLTALSQLHNLYMVAYQSQIFVYVPRGVPTQRIPRYPDLRLFPPRSNVSRDIGGYLDPDHPHVINHLIVGSLGNEELVLTSHDDGDVVAYSTSKIADWIASRPRRRADSAGPPVQTLLQNDFSPHGPGSQKPKPFFHENVGRSAWGLAVHKKSRLIAVSSNHCDVTVFAPALSSEMEGGRPNHDWCEECSGTRPVTCDKVDSHVRQRARNWRIVVSLGSAADNLPNVCFIDDAAGWASMVCAVDIKGATWMADIWQSLLPATCITDGRRSDRMGWGILVLPETSFFRVETVKELLGANDQGHIQPLPQGKLSISPTLRDIADNPCELLRAAARNMAPNASPVWIPPSDAWPFDSEDEWTEVEEIAVEDHTAEEQTAEHQTAEMVAAGAEELSEADAAPLQQLLIQLLPSAGAPQNQVSGEGPAEAETLDTPSSPSVEDVEDDDSDEEEGQKRKELKMARRLKLDMAYYPHLGQTMAIPDDKDELLAVLKREVPNRHNRTGWVIERDELLEKHYLFRFFLEDVELGKLTSGAGVRGRELGTVCPGVIKNVMKRPTSPARRLLFRGTDRINMVAYVPELCLVVAASANGRVVLLTPTRLGQKVEYNGRPLKVGFRVEWILPRRSDEARRRRVPRPLHGMAVGPVQESSAETEAGAGRPKRFRLMLHYWNHDILTYEMTRVEETGKLCIF